MRFRGFTFIILVLILIAYKPKVLLFLILLAYMVSGPAISLYLFRKKRYAKGNLPDIESYRDIKRADLIRKRLSI